MGHGEKSTTTIARIVLWAVCPLGIRASFPHYSMLKKFADRTCVQDIVDGMLLELVQRFAADEKEVAIDSTGFKTTCASTHFRTKSGRNRTKFIKVSVCVMATSLLPSSVVLG